MSNLAEDVQDRAIDKCLFIVVSNNKRLGEKLQRNRSVIFRRMLTNIQRIGVTDYAKRILKYHSHERADLEFLIDED